jgi:hypothetical protein
LAVNLNTEAGRMVSAAGISQNERIINVVVRLGLSKDVLAISTLDAILNATEH